MVNLNYIEIGKRIRSQRKSLGLTQKELGKLLGLSEGSISKYESGKVEDATTTRLNDFATTLKVDIAWLLATPIKEQEKIGNLIQLPIVGKICCGNGSFAYEEIEGYESTPESWLNGGEYFYLRAKGDSMKNARIQEGDLLLIRRQSDVEDGEIAVIQINDEAILRKVYKRDGMLLLQSENPDYPPIICDGKEGSKIKILGKLKKIVITY